MINNKQELAISHTDGVCVVVAPPGSGKTHVIIQRVFNLVIRWGISPSSIFVLSFTRLAAAEMRYRYQNIDAVNSDRINFGTFHSIFMEILVAETEYTYQSIMTNSVKLRLLRVVLERLGLRININREFSEAIFKEISRWKNMGVGYISGIKEPICECVGIIDEDFRKIYQAVAEEMRLNNNLDFDDILIECYRLFIDRKDVLSKYQKKMKYIMVDEFQDTNNLQYLLLKLVGKPNNNIFVVGDDDQSIYGFRGANPEIMRKIYDENISSKLIKLDVNYRSTRNIVELAKNLIVNNNSRFDKEYNSLQGYGEDVVLDKFNGLEDEVIYISCEIKKIVEQDSGYKYSDIAILARTTAQFNKFIPVFKLQSIPFNVKENLTSFYSNEVVKDILAYLRFIYDERKAIFLRRVINKPNRYISQSSFSDGNVDIETIRNYYIDKNNNSMVLTIKRLESQIRMADKMDLYCAINYIRKGMGYDDYINELEGANKRMESFKLLDELQQRSKGYRSIGEWIKDIDSEEEVNVVSGKKDGVNIMTIHAAKGLEYKAVFVIDLLEGYLPYHKATSDEEIEEERRLLYVAITRAKEKLYCLGIEEDKGDRGYVLSRFYKELV